jgi:hypothetical protein
MQKNCIDKLKHAIQYEYFRSRIRIVEENAIIENKRE